MSWKEELLDKYPELVGDRSDPRKSLMCFGLEVRNGWKEILEDLFPKLDKVRKERLPHLVLQQVKEKFGELRVYTSSGDDEVYAFIREAEKRSSETCEDCGKLGEVRTGGWITTLCDECYKKR